MNMPIADGYLDVSILFIALLALLLNWFAYQKGFYRFSPIEGGKKESLLNIAELLICFAIYLIFSLILAPIFAKLYLNYLHLRNLEITALTIAQLSTIQLVTMGIIFIGLMLYMSIKNPKRLLTIWKDRTVKSHSIIYDFGMGVLAWLFAFPLVVVLNQLSDYFLYKIFGPQTYEQAAVRFVKTALENPSAFAMSMVSVLLMAPIIEEFLFRGCLQNVIKSYLGSKVAIQVSALCFALFHLTPSQGIGNISLAISLFLLGLFLGFLYEKQASLFASIGLHMTFNTVSAMRILFFPEAAS